MLANTIIAMAFGNMSYCVKQMIKRKRRPFTFLHEDLQGQRKPQRYTLLGSRTSAKVTVMKYLTYLH